MSARRPYLVDLDDPRAPSVEEWAGMTEEERATVLEQLPSEIESALPPEGDVHRKAAHGPLYALDAYFRRVGRRVYLSSNLPVYYPAERMFAPDLIAVTEVEPHERNGWVVSAEGRGLEFALEVLYSGDDRKDLERNVERFARLGIHEYFIYDRKRGRLVGYTLEQGHAKYGPIVPRDGRWASRVLGLELALETDRVRFYAGAEPLQELLELAERGEHLLRSAILRAEQGERQAEEEGRRAEEEARRAEEEARRAKHAEQEVERLQAELLRLRAESRGS